MLGLPGCVGLNVDEFEKRLRKSKTLDRKTKADLDNPEVLLERRNLVASNTAPALVVGEHDMASMEIVRDIQEAFKGHIFRRTGSAKDPRGIPIWGGPAPFEQTITLNLSAGETKVIATAAEHAYADRGLNWHTVRSKSFLK